MIETEIILDRLERTATLLGEERVLRSQAEDKAAQVNFHARYVTEMVECMANGRKIEAIKLYRQITGTGLKESKDAIERVTNQFAPTASAA